jgi:hypothetical protein
VISGGPSRKHITQADLLPESPVVTVNRAIDVVDLGITVDFACFADPPAHIYKLMGLERYLVPPIQVWVPRPAMYKHNDMPAFHDMVSLWEPFLPASVGIRTTPFGTVKCEDGESTRYFFCLLAALLRVTMFKPEAIRIISADMMGSWEAGMSEEECERRQSDLEQARKELGSVQRHINETRGRDPQSIQLREELRVSIKEMEKLGPPEGFRRWQHERFQLKGFQAHYEKFGVKIEWVSPKSAVLT